LLNIDAYRKGDALGFLFYFLLGELSSAKVDSSID